MGIVREAHEVTSQILHPTEKSLRILRAESPTIAKRSLLMHRNPAQKNGLPVQQNLGSLHLDRTKPNLIADGIATAPEDHVIELGVRRRPQLQLRCQVKTRSTRRIGRNRLVNSSFRNLHRNLGWRLCSVQLHPARN